MMLVLPHPNSLALIVDGFSKVSMPERDQPTDRSRHGPFHNRCPSLTQCLPTEVVRGLEFSVVQMRNADGEHGFPSQIIAIDLLRQRHRLAGSITLTSNINQPEFCPGKI